MRILFLTEIILISHCRVAYGTPTGNLLKVGDLLCQRAMAETLRNLSLWSGNDQEFSKGVFMRKMALEAQAAGERHQDYSLVLTLVNVFTNWLALLITSVRKAWKPLK